MLRVVRRLALIITILSAGCAEPPNKEMNQAQGAIDAARAAGAEKFAAQEFTAAVDALKRSEDAVAAGDYRQALGYAIDSRERAQTAAKTAVDGRTEARGQAERTISEVATLVARAHTELKAPELARNSRLRSARTVVADAEQALQKAVAGSRGQTSGRFKRDRRGERVAAAGPQALGLLPCPRIFRELDRS
jgi:hypothetical protein